MAHPERRDVQAGGSPETPAWIRGGFSRSEGEGALRYGRRRILHFNVTRYPPPDWVVQQLCETFAEAAPYRYAILDHDSIFNVDVTAFLKATGLKPKRTSIQAPWQNGIAERWIGSCRREALDHIIPVNEEHLHRLIRDYVRYHQEDRVHDSLSKDTPNRRPIEPNPTTDASLISLPRLGGLHHRTRGDKRHRNGAGDAAIISVFA